MTIRTYYLVDGTFRVRTGRARSALCALSTGDGRWLHVSTTRIAAERWAEAAAIRESDECHEALAAEDRRES